MVREHLVEQGSTYQKKGGQGLISKYFERCDKKIPLYKNDNHHSKEKEVDEDSEGCHSSNVCCSLYWLFNHSEIVSYHLLLSQNKS